MLDWLLNRSGKHHAFVAEVDSNVTGWASINAYQAKCCFSGVVDLSIYMHRDWRNRGIGMQLLTHLLWAAKEAGFHKMVLSVLAHNYAALRLYQKAGFRVVGTHEQHGFMDGHFVDVTLMERLL